MEGFENCVEEDDQNEVLSEQNTIIIKVKQNCYCYDDFPGPTEFFTVHKTHNSITTKDAIHAMKDYRAKCNHVFLEGFEKDTDVHFSACFGS